MNERQQAALRAMFWLVVVASATVGIILLAVGNLLPGAAVLGTGAVLAAVLGLLPRLADSGILSSGVGARRNAKAMLATAGVGIAVGAVLMVVEAGVVAQVVLTTSLGLGLGSVAMLVSTSQKDGA